MNLRLGTFSTQMVIVQEQNELCCEHLCDKREYERGNKINGRKDMKKRKGKNEEKKRRGKEGKKMKE